LEGIPQITDRAREEPKIVPLREAGKLRDVVEPDVGEAARARSAEATEELLGRLLGENPA
jgi:hypothetical protein